MDERSIVVKNFEALLARWTVEDPFYGDIFQGIEGRRIEASLRSRSSGWTAGIPGGIKLKDISLLVEKGVDILDIGAAILDAPWLDLTYDVVR